MPYTFSLTRAKNGTPTLTVTVDTGEVRYLTSAYDPVHEAHVRMREQACEGMGNVVVLGIGLGHELAELLSRHKPAQRIWVVEKSPEIIALARTTIAPDVWNHTAVTMLVDQDPDAVSSTLTRAGVSTMTVIRHPSTQQVFTEYYDEVQKRLAAIQPPPPAHLNVIIIVGKGIVAPFIVQDIACTFEACGCTTWLFPVNGSEALLREHMGTVRPDVVFALDSTGLLLPQFASLPCLKVAWFVDNPLYFLPQNLPKDTIIFCWDAAYIQLLEQYGFSQVLPLPLATNPSIFSPRHLSSDIRKRFSCEVNFVGSVGGSSLLSAVAGPDLSVQALPKPSLIERSMQCLWQGKPDFLLTMLASSRTTEEHNASMGVFAALDHEGGSLVRQEVVKVLGRFHSLLFGSETLRAFETGTCRYGGRIDYHAELPLLFNATDITINVTRPQLITTVNQRVYDVAATRSFFLTDYRPALKELFPSGDVEQICYHSPDELKEKITYYLQHPTERRALAENMYHAVLARHTYRHRVETMLRVLQTL